MTHSPECEPNLLKSLSEEELTKREPISEDEILSALQEGMRDRVAIEAISEPVPSESPILYR